MKVSIAMTTFNGEQFLKEQLDSIICQLYKDDEIIISDDGSQDNTIDILKKYSEKDSRIQVFLNKGLGVVKNFEFALSRCKNDIIFLADQDDIWDINKIEKCRNILKNSKYDLVLHNGKHFVKKNNIVEEYLMIKKMNHGVLRNIIMSSYWGCCMAFKITFLKSILPFPKELVAHDQWIGLLAEAKKSSVYLNENLIMHRVHNNNVTKKGSLFKKIKFRINLLLNFSKHYLGFTV